MPCSKSGIHILIPVTNMLEPSQNEYEREHEETIRKNLRRIEEFGISDSIPEVEEPDNTNLEEMLIPLAIEGPVRTGRRKVCVNKRKTSGAMAPGGRHSKRVRSIPPTEVTPGASTRLPKRLQTSAPCEKPVQEELPQVAEYTSGDDNVVQQELLVVVENTSGDDNVNNHSSPLRDWSYEYDEDHDDAPDLNKVETGWNNDSGQLESRTEAPTQRVGSRNARPPIRGILLDKMTKAIGRRIPISVAEGNTKPYESVQATKFASEAGVIVRSQVPIFPHWKDYKEETKHFEGFVGSLSGRLAIDRRDKATTDACRRYKLKQKHFVGVPANEIPTTSLFSYMTDLQWCKLVDKWSTAHNKAISDQNK
ncbi:hypothetical protein SETIT_8G103400v2 [Setaria italica]|uniref:Uncharacterized protein n=1 Tax=Setaria italica TaxID=4555 RepID=A0A368S7W3_SETIT|nr:hypothetical protein SETIT_8G103400v2 [Setaria italica]